VVLRTRLVGSLTPSVLTRTVGANGAGAYTEAAARTVLDRMPPGMARAVVPLPGAFLVELSK
jgi:hypothetical protein